MGKRGPKAKPKGPCSHPPCDRQATVAGWCHLHYQRVRDGVEMDRPPRNVGRPPCVYPGCEKPNCARGYCTQHYQRLIHTGSVELDPFKYQAERHPNWKGGLHGDGHGYWIRTIHPSDPLYTQNDGKRQRIKEHRYVMGNALGRPLRSSESVHHINGDPSDNRIENLQLRQGKHGNGVVMACLDCGGHNLGEVPIA